MDSHANRPLALHPTLRPSGRSICQRVKSGLTNCLVGNVYCDQRKNTGDDEDQRLVDKAGHSFAANAVGGFGLVRSHFKTLRTISAITLEKSSKQTGFFESV